MKLRLTNAAKDLALLLFSTIFVFVLSYFFNVFIALVDFFKKQPGALVWVDEIVTGLLTLSIGFTIFSWRRWWELKKETAERMRLQEQIIQDCQIKAETERIICRQLHCDIAEYKKIEKDVLLSRLKSKEQPAK